MERKKDLKTRLAPLLWLVDYRNKLFICQHPILSSPSLPCSVITIASYTKIFRTFSRHQAQVQDYFQQPSQPNSLNVAQYRKAVSSTLWVQLALVVCYVPSSIVEVVMTYSKTYSSSLRYISVSQARYNCDWLLLILKISQGTI